MRQMGRSCSHRKGSTKAPKQHSNSIPNKWPPPSGFLLISFSRVTRHSLTRPASTFVAESLPKKANDYSRSTTEPLIRLTHYLFVRSSIRSAESPGMVLLSKSLTGGDDPLISCRVLRQLVFTRAETLVVFHSAQLRVFPIPAFCKLGR